MARAYKFTQAQNKPTYYSDIDDSFSLVPTTGNLSVVTNENSVYQSILRIVLTGKYERLYNPDFGSKVPSLMFELSDPLTAKLIETEIENTVRTFEPRIDKFTLEIELRGHDVLVRGIFTLVNISKDFPFTFSVKRVR